MGNCINRRAAVSWTDEEEWDEDYWVDQEATTTAKNHHRRHFNVKCSSSSSSSSEEEEKAELLKGRRTLPSSSSSSSSSSPAVAATEVKIKISKKQLEELLRRVEKGRGQEELRSLPLHHLLTHLLTAGDDAFHAGARHWRPALQSIPEAAAAE